jgi:hypothetical protein
MPSWLDDLQRTAPAAVGAYRSFEADRPIAVRRAVRRAAGDGSAERSVGELGATAAALEWFVDSLPEGAFRAPGGEEDWNVAQAIGHAATSRAGLVLAASLAATGRWPSDAPRVVPGIPGAPDDGRIALLDRIRRSQRMIERIGTRVAGHEPDPCPLDHPLVGHLRCGEWLVFAAVHDLMHLNQLHGVGARMPAAAASRA